MDNWVIFFNSNYPSLVGNAEIVVAETAQAEEVCEATVDSGESESKADEALKAVVNLDEGQFVRQKLDELVASVSGSDAHDSQMQVSVKFEAVDRDLSDPLAAEMPELNWSQVKKEEVTESGVADAAEAGMDLEGLQIKVEPKQDERVEQETSEAVSVLLDLAIEKNLFASGVGAPASVSPGRKRLEHLVEDSMDASAAEVEAGASSDTCTASFEACLLKAAVTEHQTVEDELPLKQEAISTLELNVRIVFLFFQKFL